MFVFVLPAPIALCHKLAEVKRKCGRDFKLKLGIIVHLLGINLCQGEYSALCYCFEPLLLRDSGVDGWNVGKKRPGTFRQAREAQLIATRTQAQVLVSKPS